MRTFLFALAFGAVSLQALADDLSQPAQGRDFWRSALVPQARQDPANLPRFTTTYTEGVARRLGLSNGNLDVFEQKLGGRGSPGLAAGIQHGTAKIELRWHPGE